MLQSTFQKKYLMVCSSILACLFLIACTAIDFDFDEESPIIVLANGKDTITVDDDYMPLYSVTDDKDNQQNLIDNIVIWVEDENGTQLTLENFTEYPGIYFIYFKVTDSDGNTSEVVTLEVLVSEDDKTPPVLTVLGPTPLILNIGDTYHDPGVKAIDNIDGDITDKVEYSGEVNTYKEDNYTRTYTVSDAAGNTATAQRIVTIKDSQGSDKEKPEMKLLGDNPFMLLVGQKYEDPGATATDNVDGNISYKIVKHDTIINTTIADTNLVYYTVEDAAGNTAMTTRSVIVKEYQDTIPPMITLKGENPMHLNKGDAYVEPGAKAEDNIDGDISDKIAIDNNEVNIQANGVYTVYYSVSDAAGNTDTDERRVIVGIVDSVPPVISLRGPNPCSTDVYQPYNEPGAYAEDDVDGTIEFNDFDVDHNIDINKLGSYTVTYTVSDASGNESSKERTVEVVDTIAPVIELNGPNPVNLGLGYLYTEAGVKSAIDNYDGDLTSQVEISGDVNSTVGGTYIVTYRVSDSHGNEGVVERIVNVAKDTDPPILTLKGDNPMNLFLGQTYIEPGATAYDSVDGDLTDKIEINGDVNSSVAGTYTITYTVSDTGGNIASDERIVTVEQDDEPPVITLKGDNPLPLKVGDSYNEPGATAIDNVDGDLSSQIQIDNSDVNTSAAGTYEVIYSVSDLSGNKAEKIRTVIVSTDNIPPVITLKGQNPMEVKIDQTYNEPGATATDNVDGDITNKIVITGNVNTSVEGTYTVNYKVTDNAGNTASKDRTVKVVPTGIQLSESDNNSTIFNINEETTYSIPFGSNKSVVVDKQPPQSNIDVAVNGGSFKNFPESQWYCSMAASAGPGGELLLTVKPNSSSASFKIAWVPW